MSATKHTHTLGKRYKNLIVRTKNLIITPKHEWKAIFDNKTDFNNILSEFTLPFIGFITLIAFINSITATQKTDFTLALKIAVAEFASYFLCLLATYFITHKIIPQFVKKTTSKEINHLAIKMVAYSSVIIYLTKIAVLLIPQFYFINYIFPLYTGYLVWLATKQLGSFENNDLRIVLTIIVTLLLLLLPYMISKVIIQFSGI